MVKQPQPFILHINDAITQIGIYLKGYSYPQFIEDKKTQDAVIRQLEVIGEAASKLEKEFKSSHPAIPWRQITDFRNVLAHEYWDVDIEIVWKVATVEIEEFKKALLPIVENYLKE